MMVLEEFLPGIQRPVALVAVTEKGSIRAKVTARGISGHSMTPPVHNAIVTLSKALSKLALANIWLFGPVISWFLSRERHIDPMIRTTTTVTRIHGGIKDNVVPAEVHAYINHRVHPSQSVAEVVERDRQLLNGLPNVSLEILYAMEAHPVSPHSHNDLGFHAIGCSVRKIFPEAIPVPALLLANTDTEYYLDLSHNVYRFSPGASYSTRDVKSFPW
ncbi:hypothetical protein MTO96_032493 [Rhipicephalus appendiculatus]